MRSVYWVRGGIGEFTLPHSRSITTNTILIQIFFQENSMQNRKYMKMSFVLLPNGHLQSLISVIFLLTNPSKINNNSKFCLVAAHNYFLLYKSYCL